MIDLKFRQNIEKRLENKLFKFEFSDSMQKIIDEQQAKTNQWNKFNLFKLRLKVNWKLLPSNFSNCVSNVVLNFSVAVDAFPQFRKTLRTNIFCATPIGTANIFNANFRFKTNYALPVPNVLNDNYDYVRFYC